MNLPVPPGGIVVGIGTDLIECSRVARVFERQRDRFLDRVFTEGERHYCLQMRNPIPHLAARFAAKEAVSKAFGTGIGAELGWKSVEVAKGARGEPLILLDPKGTQLMQSLNASSIAISLSHTSNYAHAIAVVLR